MESLAASTPAGRPAGWFLEASSFCRLPAMIRSPEGNFGLAASRLLLPIDLARCPLEIFSVANRFARPAGGEIILLHVRDARTRNAPDSGSPAELRRRERYLQRLGQDYLRPGVSASFRVRTGVPHEEIRADALAAGADLILLPVFAQPFWKKLRGIHYGETARELILSAPCRMFVVDADARFDCFRRWRKEEDRSEWAA